MSVGAIQETKWFGNDIWYAEEYTFLHPGCSLPVGDDNTTRREGVGIAGEIWEAVSSRIVTARLKLARLGQRMIGGSRERSHTFVTVISAYAPTPKAPPEVKQQFTEDL